MPTLQIVMDNSDTLQQTYDVNRTPAYLPDRGSKPLIVAMKITQPTLGGSIQLAANQLNNIKWGTELGASDLQPYANGLIFTLMDNGFVPAGTSKSVYFQAEYTNPLNKVVQTVNFNFELITLVTGAQGQQGDDGAVGATLSMLTNREPVFSFADDVPTVFSDIVFTVSTQNLNSPTYIWYVGAEPTTNTTNTYSVSSAAFGNAHAMQLVCYVTSAEGVTYSVTGSVNRVNFYTAEAGATNGATVGFNLRDSAAGILYGTDILNKYSNAAQLAGDLSGNPFLVRVDAEYDRPAKINWCYWKARF
jgi:hypothetical protein